MKIVIILGTRPEIIKLCSIIRACEEQSLDYFVIHTNQHYSSNMDEIFFKELNLKPAKYNLKVGSGTHGEQTAKMMIGIEKILLDETPDVVLVQGDTNSVLAGALVASKMDIKLGHVEAGLRSYDREMPEEINRVVTDHISDYLFCPTVLEQGLCTKEGIDPSKVFVTGNTIVDAVSQNSTLVDKDVMFAKYNLTKGNYLLVTMHRPSNVDSKEVLQAQLSNVSELAIKHNLKVIFPVHPRTSQNITKFKIFLPGNITLCDPIGYLDMLVLIDSAKMVLTDSGGIQEEACILQTPSLNLRENTERPQSVEVGASIIVGVNRDKLFDGYKLLVSKSGWDNPFGDGFAGKNMLSILRKRYKN